MNYLLESVPLTVFEQMAFDETLVYVYPGHGFWLRFFPWMPGKAVTFGYAQFYDEVQKETRANGFSGPLARRPTGGGIVYHADDLTFSCIFKTQQTRPKEIYETLHGLINKELRPLTEGSRMLEQELPAAAYAPSVNQRASSCFANPVQNDILAADGHKILGGAIRRFGDIVLYQGSLQAFDARNRDLYKWAIVKGLSEGMGIKFEPLEIEADTLEKALSLAQTQYQSKAWNEKF